MMLMVAKLEALYDTVEFSLMCTLSLSTIEEGVGFIRVQDDQFGITLLKGGHFSQALFSLGNIII